MDYEKRIKAISETSKKVFKDCVFPGGAIVAANSFQSYFPKDAKNYKFVWPRDGAFICYASSLLKMDIADNFFNWCMKAEGWEQKGIFYEKYYISGKQAAHNFQPDQTGTLLWAVCQLAKENSSIKKKYDRLIVKSADGISQVWSKDHFCLVSEDLWEERLCFPDLKENFFYSLAAVYQGLMAAYELKQNESWKKTADEIAGNLEIAVKKFVGRSFGKMNDERIDASLLGLIWPFNIDGISEGIREQIIGSIEKHLVKNNGVYRYEHDEYDGWMYNKNIHRRKGAGYWPLLNFWISIALVKLGEKEKADIYFRKVVDDMGSDFIPEQVFDNEYQVSVSPLCWSHAKFIIAAKELGYLE